MKRLSIKAKLTVLYSSLMMLLIIFIIGLFFTYSSQEILSHTKATLEEHVSSSFDNIDYKHDSYHFDNDILELEDGVYLSVYDAKTQELVYGRVPLRMIFLLRMDRCARLKAIRLSFMC